MLLILLSAAQTSRRLFPNRIDMLLLFTDMAFSFMRGERGEAITLVLLVLGFSAIRGLLRVYQLALVAIAAFVASVAVVIYRSDIDTSSVNQDYISRVLDISIGSAREILSDSLRIRACHCPSHRY